MLWEDTTLSRPIRDRADLRDRSSDRIWRRGWGPVEVERWRIWAVGCNSPKRLQATDGSVAPPVPSVTTQVIPEIFCVRTGAMTWTGLNVDRLRPAQDCVKILTTE